MKATEQYFPDTLYLAVQVVLTVESVGEMLNVDHSNESY